MKAFLFQPLYSLHHYLRLKEYTLSPGYGGPAVSAAIVAAILDLQICPGVVCKGMGIEGEDTSLALFKAFDCVVGIHPGKHHISNMLGKRKNGSLLRQGEDYDVITKILYLFPATLCIAACYDDNFRFIGEKPDHTSGLLLSLGCHRAGIYYCYLSPFVFLLHFKAILYKAICNGFAFTLVETAAESIDVDSHAFSPFSNLYPTFSSAILRL